MNRIALKDLQELWNYDSGPCVSLYMPVHGRAGAGQEDAILLKNLLRRARKDLIRTGLRAPEAGRFLAPLEAGGSESAFWREGCRGLAAFLAPSFFRLDWLDFPPPQRVVVSSRFHTRPLLDSFYEYPPFYILALSMKCVRLLAVKAREVKEVDLAGLSGSLDSFLRFEESGQDLQFRQEGGTGGAVGTTFSHGGGEADRKDALLRYFREVDRVVRGRLPDSSAPLVWAGVDYLFPIYREAGGHPGLMEAFVPGNPDRLSNEELMEKGREIVRPVYLEQREQALGRFRRLAGTGHTAIAAERVVPAAVQGQVETLFYRPGAERWARYDPAAGIIEPHPQRGEGDEELLDLAVSHACRYGATVFPVPEEVFPAEQMPAGMAAVLRY